MLDFEDAAVRAGLGEIGYCGVFLSPKFGPRQRLQVILTDAPLEPEPLFEGSICDRDKDFHANICPLKAIHQEKERELVICGKKMLVAFLDFSKCKICKNGALPNMYHPSGNPERLAAICVRSCIDYLERAGKLTSTFHSPFRKREPWTRV